MDKVRLTYDTPEIQGILDSVARKQDAIDDLEEIREGAKSGGLAYRKPDDGIPKTDLVSAVQASLGKADSALQSHQDISGKEDTSNKVTSLSSSSNNTQYPSALCVYNLVRGLTEVSYEPVTTLPTASSTTMNKIYVVASTGVMYMTKEESGSYSWMEVGTLPSSLSTITDGEIDALFE